MSAVRTYLSFFQMVIAAVTIAASISASHAGAADPPSKKLNILFIVSDDLTTTALGTYGQKVCQTPNIDRLASRGVRFDRAFCNYPVCNPSRTSFLSGRYPESTQVLNNATDPRSELGKAYQFLPEYFKTHGYFTAGIGKVAHGGFSDAVSWDVVADPQRPGKGQDDDERLARAQRRNAGGAQTTGGKKKLAAQADEATTFAWEATANDDAEEPDGKTARRVAALIEEHKEGPFFIAAGFHKPHVPHTAPKKYFDRYPPEKIPLIDEPAAHDKQIPAIAQNNKYAPDFTAAQARATISHYFAATTFMDVQVGILLETLDRLDLWKSTIVVFIGDHGWHFGEHGGYWAKGSLFDESARAPLIVAAPSFKANAATSGLVEFVDIYPTFTELAGLPAPSGLQGQSFAQLLSDPQRPGKRAIFTVVSRQRSLGRAVRAEKFTYIEWPDGSTQLYDSNQDPKEYVNLSQDPAYAQTKAELKSVLTESRLSAQGEKVSIGSTGK
jgi:iduronate 2-sulfatase